MKTKIKTILSFTLFICLVFPFSRSECADFLIRNILEMKINASINPATLKYLSGGFHKAHNEHYSAILIKMNTPGGLVTTTKEIITLIGESDLPVFIWVTPEGASATSAGAIISSAAHLLYMSEGTNIGAATPVSIGPSGSEPAKKDNQENLQPDLKSKLPKLPIGGVENNDDSLKRKALNDLMALVRSLSEARGRNGELFAEMISEASSFEAQTALDKNIINGIISSPQDLLKQIENKTITIKGNEKKLLLDGIPTIEVHEMNLGESILNIFANPSLAYILFILGAALIYLEFQTAGGFVAGALGTLALILAGISFQVLPLNFGALGLIVLSFVLFIIEMYVVSYGMLTIAGLLSLTFGSLFLFNSDNSYIEVPLLVIFSTILSIASFLLFIGLFWYFDSKKIKKGKRKQSDHMGLIGKTAIIIAKLPNEGSSQTFQVKLNGEIWKAKTFEDQIELKINDRVIIEEIIDSGLSLKIKK